MSTVRACLKQFDTPTMSSDITPTENTQHHKPRTDKAGGGVRIFTKTDFPHDVIDIPSFKLFEVISLSTKYIMDFNSMWSVFIDQPDLHISAS